MAEVTVGQALEVVLGNQTAIMVALRAVLPPTDPVGLQKLLGDRIDGTLKFVHEHSGAWSLLL